MMVYFCDSLFIQFEKTTPLLSPCDSFRESSEDHHHQSLSRQTQFETF